MLDGRVASEYYADTNAGSHIVNPTNGVRFDNGQVWGSYEVYNNWGSQPSDYGGWCSNGRYYFYWRFVGTCINRLNYKGGDTIYNMSWGTGCWNESLHNAVGRETVAPSCYKQIVGWH